MVAHFFFMNPLKLHVGGIIDAVIASKRIVKKLLVIANSSDVGLTDNFRSFSWVHGLTDHAAAIHDLLFLSSPDTTSHIYQTFILSSVLKGHAQTS